MATIALYANKVNQMPGLIKNVKKSVIDYKSELAKLRKKTLSVDRKVCDMDDIISSMQSSTQTQEEKIQFLDKVSDNVEQFVSDLVTIDNKVCDMINQKKDDFYEKYSYLKPQCESDLSDWIKEGWQGVKEWCAEHWKQVVTSIVIVAGAALAVAAVICTGGMALVPILSAGLAMVGVGAGTALSIATTTSLIIATIAVTSTVLSSTVNIISVWKDMSGNAMFKVVQTSLNWISAISNISYSMGSLYNSFKGISGCSLRQYSKAWRTDSGFRQSIRNADTYNFSLKPNSSVFWTGMRENGGEHVAKNYVSHYGGSSLETSLQDQGLARPTGDWRPASASLALRTSGNVRQLVGSSPWSGSVWNTTEKLLLNINPRVTEIKQIIGVTTNVIARKFSWESLFAGVESGVGVVLHNKKN